MPTYFQKPENALKRADEFIEVGKKQRGLDALYDVIKSKKHRTWQKIHEPIMKKYLTLCVELKKSHLAKEGLYQYKNICQQVNIKSLEDVVREYLRLAEEQTEAARQESQQQVIDVDDLDIIQTPESLLLSAVSGEDTQDRTDRAILTPWVKFLWESYRQCLDLLRNNNRVERLYQDIAQMAFKFCLKYARKTEFRKLCDNLRTHLTHIHKHQNQQTAVNLNNPDSQAMHLETRLVQLDSAVEMDLWQEAFKAVEDVHGMINISKKPPKPSLMANYYQKFGVIFFKANNPLFHAAAWYKLFHLSREQRKNLSQEELQRLSSHVLCATLSVPLPPTLNNIDQLLENNVGDKHRRLATLLGLPNPPTRVSLIKELTRFNMLQYVHPELQDLYNWLEVEFHPLKLSNRVTKCLQYVEQNEDLAMYVPALQEFTVVRLLQQVSQVYHTIEFKRLSALAPFVNTYQLEKIVVQSARNIDLQVRVDHRTQSLNFGTDLCVSQREDVQEGPFVQNMPSEQIRLQLSSIGNALFKANALIKPKDLALQEDELRQRIVQAYKQTAKKDHIRILQRRQIIEDRKEELENASIMKEQAELALQEEQEQKLKDAEEKRLERERDERAKQRRLEEHKEIQRKHAKERLDQLMKSDIGARAFKDINEDDLADLDADEIMAKQVEQLEKEKKELNDRLKAQEKKVDHLARAKRIEELPCLGKFVEENREKAKEFWEQQEEERIEEMKHEREIGLQNKGRMLQMVDERDSFLHSLMTARASVFKEKAKDFEKRFAEERKKRLAERKVSRKEERRRQWYQEKEEAEQREHDELLKREREASERLEREEKENERAEYEERLRKLEEIAAKQREREKEIEERERKQAEDRKRDMERQNTDHPSMEDSSAWRPKGRDGGGGWREREKEREDSWRAPSSRKMEESIPQEEGGWRRSDKPARDDDRWGRDEPAPPRDEGRWRRDEPPKEDDRWRRGDDREAPREDAWRRRGETPRDDPDRGQPPSREDDWRRGSGRDDKEPPARVPPRDDRGPSRDFREPSRDDDWRRGQQRDRAPPSREDEWRRDRPRDEPPQREESWRGRDDRGPPPREDAWRNREDRGGRDERGESAWRRGGDDKGRRDEGPWNRSRGGEDSWRPSTGDRTPQKDSWRDREKNEDRAPRRRDEDGRQDDGWTTVRR